MKKILCYFSVFCVKIFLSVFLVSCGSFFGNDEDEVIEEYTSGFTTATSTTETSSTFTEDDMLLDYYIVSSNATLVLTAPDAVSYKWTFVDDSDGTDVTNNIVFLTGYHSWTQTIMIYIPESAAIVEGKTYRVTLKITTEGGKTYTDVCGLVVYALLDGGKY